MNRPGSPLAGRPGASGQQIQDHCEDLTNDPDAFVPHELDEFAFERKESIAGLRSDGNPLVQRGRKGDLWYRALGHSNGSQPGHTLNGLSEEDKAAIESHHQEYFGHMSQSLVDPSVPPDTSVL